MIPVVSVFLSLNLKLLVQKHCCVCHVKLFLKSVSDHCSVDFLGKVSVLI